MMAANKKPGILANKKPVNAAFRSAMIVRKLLSSSKQVTQAQRIGCHVFVTPASNISTGFRRA